MKIFIKFTSVILAAMGVLSCTSAGGDEQVAAGKLQLSADKSYVQANTDEYVTLTAECDGVDVTSQTTFYIGTEALDSPVFVPAEAGIYKIWANYGTENSNEITITAISVPVPASPEDLKPEATSFVPRVLLSQFTGTGCGNCPRMMKLLHGDDGLSGVLHDSEIGEQVVWVSVHSFNENDLAFYNGTYPTKLGCTGYPCGNVDYSITTDFSAHKDYNTPKSFKDNLIKPLLSEKASTACGISVSSSMAEGQIVMKATVKAAEDNEYRIGAFLLQDDIKEKQSGADKTWMNTHNACVRYVDAGGRNDFNGHKLGEIKQGKTAEFLYIWDLETIWSEMQGNIFWDGKSTFLAGENLRLVVFVVSPNASGNYYINNVVEAPVNGTVQFDYAE